MKLLLLKRVDGLGSQGDVVDVSDGHARNFLIPRGLARPATGAALKEKTARDEAAKRRAQGEQDRAKAAVRKLEGKVVRLSRRANEAGILYGAVTASEVAEAIGPAIDPSHVRIDEPIKAVGTHRARVELPGAEPAGITIEITAA